MVCLFARMKQPPKKSMRVSDRGLGALSFHSLVAGSSKEGTRDHLLRDENVSRKQVVMRKRRAWLCLLYEASDFRKFFLPFIKLYPLMCLCLRGVTREYQLFCLLQPVSFSYVRVTSSSLSGFYASQSDVGHRLFYHYFAMVYT